MSRDLKKLKVKDLFTVDRPHVGQGLAVPLWRILRYPALYQVFGDEADSRIYQAGKAVGKMLEMDSVEDFVKALNDLGVGLVKIKEHTKVKIIVDVAECVSCSGISPPIGKPICFFEAGLVAGFASRLLNKEMECKETKCNGGLGDNVCRLEIALK